MATPQFGHRVARAAACLALLASMVACGTTVPLADRTATQSVDGLSPGGALPSGVAPGGTSGSTSGASLSGSTSGQLPVQSGSGGTGGNGTSGAGTSTGGSGARLAPGRTPVEVGFLVTKCSNCNLLGAGYVAPAHSEQDVLQALVNDINKSGGLLGHRIVPVWGVEDTASSDFATQLAGICASFTQDHHVVAVLGAGVSFQEVLAKCLAKAHVLTYDATRSTGVPDDVDLATYKGWILTNEPSANSYGLAALTSAAADGWLTAKSKVGVLDFDCPESARAWKNTLEPYFAAHFPPVLVHSTLSCPKGAGDLGSAAQGVQSAELAMNSRGVDTVVITDIPLIVFAEDAESQQYHPHYLATEGGAAYQAYLAADQLQNIHSAGWEPSYDLDAQHQQPLSAANKACLQALTRGGLTNQVATERVAYFALCGSVAVYQHAVAAAQSLAAADLLRATDALSGSFVSPMLLGGRSYLGSGQHAAAVQYRSLLFDKKCSCFAYQGPVRPLPR